MSHGADPEHVRVGIQIRILIRGSSPGLQQKTSKQELGISVGMNIIKFFVSTNKQF
jgi:hypothetical protein